MEFLCGPFDGKETPPNPAPVELLDSARAFSPLLGITTLPNIKNIYSSHQKNNTQPLKRENHENVLIDCIAFVLCTCRLHK